MRVMVDTNVLVSAVLSADNRFVWLLDHITRFHRLVLSRATLEELRTLFETRFAHRTPALEGLLRIMPFEVADVPTVIVASEYPSIRDLSDLPILASAIASNVELFITGDKDFLSLQTDRLRIVSPTDSLRILSFPQPSSEC